MSVGESTMEGGTEEVTRRKLTNAFKPSESRTAEACSHRINKRVIIITSQN